MDLDGLSFLIVNPELGSRSRLREVIKTTVYNAQLDLAQDQKESLAKFDVNQDFDVVMVSYSLGEEQIRKVIIAAKDKYGSTPPSFIVTIEKVSHKTMGKVTNLFLEGVSGFISEPYSVSDLSELLLKVREQREKMNHEFRQKKAMRFLINESIRHVDQLSVIPFERENARGLILREMRGSAETLRTLQSKNPELFAEVMVEAFSSVPAPIKEEQTRRIKRKQKIVLHPGLEVATMMQQRNLDLERLTPSLKVELSDFQAFIEGKTPVDDKLSNELSRLFGKAPLDWLRMQKEYDHFIECQAAVAERRSESSE